MMIETQRVQLKTSQKLPLLWLWGLPRSLFRLGELSICWSGYLLTSVQMKSCIVFSIRAAAPKKKSGRINVSTFPKCTYYVQILSKNYMRNVIKCTHQSYHVPCFYLFWVVSLRILL